MLQYELKMHLPNDIIVQYNHTTYSLYRIPFVILLFPDVSVVCCA